MEVEQQGPLGFPYWKPVLRRLAVDSPFFASGNIERELLSKQVCLFHFFPYLFCALYRFQIFFLEKDCYLTLSVIEMKIEIIQILILWMVSCISFLRSSKQVFLFSVFRILNHLSSIRGSKKVFFCDKQNILRNLNYSQLNIQRLNIIFGWIPTTSKLCLQTSLT